MLIVGISLVACGHPAQFTNPRVKLQPPSTPAQPVREAPAPQTSAAPEKQSDLAESNAQSKTAPENIPRSPTVKASASQEAIAQWCTAISDKLFSVDLRDCKNRGFTDSGYRSVQGRVIGVRNVPAKRSPGIGRVLLIGGTHGDELTSVSLTFWWLNLLEKNPGNINWSIAPTMNPDGVLAEPSRRVNANNIDLNRNLPTPDWHAASREYWISVGREPRRYPGAEPASEPETRWLVNAVETFNPDVIVAVHAPYGVLDYDGEYPPPLQLGALNLHRLGVFPGSLGNYGSRFLGIPVMTVELDHATRMPSREQAQAMWQDLNSWLVRYLLTTKQVEVEKPRARGQQG